jgi:hypothetical protein
MEFIALSGALSQVSFSMDESTSSGNYPAIRVTPGDIFIRSDTPVPPSFYAFESYGRWKRLLFPPLRRPDSIALPPGWHLAFVMTRVKGRGLGCDRVIATRRALEDVTGQVSNKGCNALEVSDVRLRQVLGVSYLTIFGHCRHLARSPFLCPPDPHRYPEDLQDFEQIFRRAAHVQPEIKGI